MSIQLFDFKGHQVRVIIAEDGEPRWVASDVAKVLGYRDAERLTRRLDGEEKGTRSVGTPGGEQSVTVITEPGLYAAVLGSKVPEAREFKRWVTHDVLPSIRKRGGYLTPEATEVGADRIESDEQGRDFESVGARVARVGGAARGARQIDSASTVARDFGFGYREGRWRVPRAGVQDKTTVHGPIVSKLDKCSGVRYAHPQKIKSPRVAATTGSMTELAEGVQYV